jgi:hypothetical protein
MAETIEWQGLDTLQALIRDLPQRAQQWTVDELGQVAFEVFNESQREVPVRYGVLRASGDLEEDADGKGWSIGYGGAAAPYALAVHEDLSVPHAPPTKAKYLEDPANAALSGFEGRLQGTVEAAIVGQLPGSPGAAHGERIRRAVRQARSSSSAVRHAHGMSDAEIQSALRQIQHMTGEDLHRARSATHARTISSAIARARKTPDQFYRAPTRRRPM